MSWVQHFRIRILNSIRGAEEESLGWDTQYMRAVCQCAVLKEASLATCHRTIQLELMSVSSNCNYYSISRLSSEVYNPPRLSRVSVLVPTGN